MPVAFDQILPRAEVSADLKAAALESMKESTRQQMEGRIPTELLEEQLARLQPDAVLPPHVATTFWAITVGQRGLQHGYYTTKKTVLSWEANLGKRPRLSFWSGLQNSFPVADH